MAENRFSRDDRHPSRNDPRSQVQHIGDVLAELLAQYEARFPGIHVTVVKDNVAA